MANKYWRPTSGSADWNTVSNWSDTPGGGAAAALPTSADDVYFTSGYVTVTLASVGACKTIYVTAGSVTLSNSASLSIYGGLVCSGTGTFTQPNTVSGQIRFEAASGSYTLECPQNGYISFSNIGYIYFLNGATYTLQCDLYAYATIALTATTVLNLNGKTVYGRSVYTYNTSTLNFGVGGTLELATLYNDNAGVTLSGSGYIKPNYTGTLTISGVAKSWPCVLQLTYGRNIIVSTGPSTFAGAELYGAVYAGSSSTLTLPASKTTTFTNFSLSGTSVYPVLIRSTTAGTQATISKSSGTVSCSYLDIKDSAATGGATWTVTDGTNSGNNSGWTFLQSPKGNGLFFGSNF